MKHSNPLEDIDQRWIKAYNFGRRMDFKIYDYCRQHGLQNTAYRFGLTKNEVHYIVSYFDQPHRQVPSPGADDGPEESL